MKIRLKRWIESKKVSEFVINHEKIFEIYLKSFLRVVTIVNRRSFLQLAGLAAVGYLLDPTSLFEIQTTDAKKISKPKIEQVSLYFSELHPRENTETIVIHNSACKSIDDVSALEIHQIHKNLGWAGIGYHFVIRKNGTIESGRALAAVGAHCYSHNENSVGICLSGNFDNEKPTKKQLKSLKNLTAWLCRKYNLDPKKDQTILGHRDLISGTSCPGSSMYPKLDDIRDFCIKKV